MSAEFGKNRLKQLHRKFKKNPNSYQANLELGLFHFKRGDIAIVHLEFVVPSTRRYVVIHDGLPAGLEAINFSLATAQKSLSVETRKKLRVDHVEVYGDKVLIFANVLPAGSYIFDYVAKAATKGKFAVPPTQIEEMYNPEVFGRTMTSEMEIE